MGLGNGRCPFPGDIERDNFRGHEDWVNAIQVSPDGRLLVTAAADSQLFLWDAATGARVWALAGHENQIVTAQFTADGRAVLKQPGRDDALMGRSHGTRNRAVCGRPSSRPAAR